MEKGSSSSSVSLKNIISQFRSITKSKSLAIKTKLESIKARITILSLLKTKKLTTTFTFRTGSISHKIHALLLGATASHEDNQLDKVLFDSSAKLADDDNNLQLVLYGDCYDDDDDGKYPDLRHSLFDEEDDPNASAIDMVKGSMERDGEDFVLEDQIDDVADLFIMKFHKRMRLQKLESFKRYQDMLERSS